MGSYTNDDIKIMFGQSNFLGVKGKGIGKGKEKIIRWEDIDYKSIPQLQNKGYDHFFDKPHIMRFIVQSKHPEIIGDIQKGQYKKPIPFE